MPSLMIRTAKWAAAAFSLLALPFIAISMIFVGYAAADAVRTFGAPAVGALLALVLAADLLWKRYARTDDPA